MIQCKECVFFTRQHPTAGDCMNPDWSFGVVYEFDGCDLGQKKEATNG